MTRPLSFLLFIALALVLPSCALHLEVRGCGSETVTPLDSALQPAKLEKAGDPPSDAKLTALCRRVCKNRVIREWSNCRAAAGGNASFAGACDVVRDTDLDQCASDCLP